MRYTILAGLMLAGCGDAMAPVQGNGPAAAAGPDTCGAAAYQHLLGKGAAASLVVPEPKRVYGAADPVTLDYLADRINVQLDNTDTIVAVTCG